MKVNSSTVQDDIWIKEVGENNTATVVLRKDFQELQDEEGETYYEFEETSIQVVNRPNLRDYIEQHFDELFALGELNIFEQSLPKQNEVLLTIVTGLMLEIDDINRRLNEVTNVD